MDEQLKELFEENEAELETSLLHIPVAQKEEGGVHALEPGGFVPILFGEGVESVQLKTISELFSGSARPPNMANPPEEYTRFFAIIEMTAAIFCAASERVLSDDEFQRVYKQLKTKPDGRDRNPLFSYLQAAVRLYMSVHEVSKAEFRAVTGRLVKSSKTFRMNKRSTNYFERVLSRFL